MRTVTTAYKLVEDIGRYLKCEKNQQKNPKDYKTKQETNDYLQYRTENPRTVYVQDSISSGILSAGEVQTCDYKEYTLYTPTVQIGTRPPKKSCYTSEKVELWAGWAGIYRYPKHI